MALMVSAPALARPMILALEERGEVRGRERVADLAEDLAARFQHDGLDVALERVPEGIVGGEEEPGVPARLHDRRPGAVRERPGVVGPVDGVG